MGMFGKKQEKKNKESSGLFGGLLGKGKQPPANKPKPQKGGKPTNPISNKGNPIQGGRPKKKPINIEETKSNEISRPKRPLAPVKESIAKSQETYGEEIYSKSDKTFSNNSMDQSIFLYVTTSKYTGITEYINSKPGIVCVGTSKLSSIQEAFKSKLDVQNVVIIMSAPEEAEYIIKFLEMLIGINGTNPNLINIILIGTKNSNKSKLISPKTVRDMQKFVKSFDINNDISDITKGHIDKIIQVVIQRQPAYTESLQGNQTEAVHTLKPKKKQHVSVDNIFNIKDIENLKKSVMEYKSKPVTEREVLEKTLEEQIILAKDPKSFHQITDIMPEVKIIRDYMKELDKYIQDATEGSEMFDINELLVNKMETSLLEEEVIRNILDNLIRASKSKIEEDDRMTRSKNEDLYKEISERTLSTEELIVQRNKLKERITNNFYEYKKEVQLLSNTVVLREQMYLDMHKSITDLLKPRQDRLSETTSELAIKFIDIAETNRKQYNEVRDLMNQKLVSTVDYTNKMFQDFNLIISMDDIIIEDLIQQNNILKANVINRSYVVDKLIKEKGIIFVITDPVIKNLSQLLFSKTSLVISFVNNVSYPDNSVIVNYKELEDPEFDYSKRMEYITLDNRDNELDMMALLENKLDFLAKDYKKVYFLCDENSSMELFDKLRRNILEGIIISNTNKDNLLVMNKICSTLLYNNSMFIKQVFNNWNRAELPKDALRALVGSSTNNINRTSMRFINTNEVSGNKEKLKELILTLRNL